MKKIITIIVLSPILIFAQVWILRYNGPGNNRDEAHAIVVDSFCNVYVTGWSPIDVNGRNADYATIKYNPFGDTLWVRRYNGPNDSNDKARAIGLDRLGNVYVTGNSWGGITKNDFATIKYNNQGEQLWVARSGGLANDEDRPYAMKVNPQGEVYVTGYSTGIGTLWDYCTIKYNTQGETAWVATFNGIGNSDDVALAIALDSVGNSYVTGFSQNESSYYDCVTIKYNPLGETVWVARYDGPSHDNDQGVGIAVNGAGEVFVTGYSWDSLTSYDYITIKYSSNGAEEWVRRYNGAANEDDRAIAITLDYDSNVYVTGSSIEFNNSDFVTIKYDGAGNEQWVARYDGLSNYNDIATAIALDPFGNVCVTGYCWSPTTANDYVTIKYTPLGETCWVAVYNYFSNLDEEAYALTTDDSGYVYVTGYSYGGQYYRDYLTIKYYPTGLTGINKTDVKSLSKNRPEIFPNPARNFVYISSSAPVQVFNVSGQLLTTFKSGTNDIRNLSKGIYFVKFRNKLLKKLVIFGSAVN